MSNNNPFIEYALRLHGDRVGDNQKPPAMVFGAKRNEFTITVYTGGRNSEGRADSIPARMTAYDFGALCSALRAAIAAPADSGFREGFRCYVPRKKQPGDTGQPKLLAATMVVGKDKQGVLYFSLVKKDTTPIKFSFRPGRMAEHLSGNEIADAALTSIRYAEAWLETVPRLFSLRLRDDVYDWQAEKNEGGNGGGNGGYNNGNRNNNGGGGNGGQRQSAPSNDFDDDLPM